MADGPIGEERVLARDHAGVEAFAPSTDAPAIPLKGPDGLDRHTRRDLRKQEQAIARQFMGGPIWPYALAAWGGFAACVIVFFVNLMNVRRTIASETTDSPLPLDQPVTAAAPASSVTPLTPASAPALGASQASVPVAGGVPAI